MKKIVIIGGGIAGLSAGVYAQKNGFESVILEKNSEVGGECFGWNRLGYHIDGCIHWLAGTNPKSPFYQIWQDIGALGSVDINHPDSFLTFEKDGVVVSLKRDLNELKKEWIEISPEDSEPIDEFCELVKKLQLFEMNIDKPQDLMSPIEKIKGFLSMMKFGPIYTKYSKMGMHEFAKKFKSPAIKAVFTALVPHNYSVFFFLYSIAAFTANNASVPKGGSLAFSKRIKDKYLSLGGKIETNCSIELALIEKGSCCEVLDSKGEKIVGDYFVFALDAHYFFNEILKGKYRDKKFDERFDNKQDYPLASEIQVSIACKTNELPFKHAFMFQVPPFSINNREYDMVNIREFSHEEKFAPKGETVLTCAINQFDDDFDYWQSLYSDKDKYGAEKERVGQEIVKRVEKRFPDLIGKLKVIDVATPVTYKRYCNAHRGAFMSFFLTINSKIMAHSGRIKGLDNLFLTGQWLQPPGGLPIAALTGRDTVMRICKKECKKFKL